MNKNRASKKLQELYDFVETFIGENGYGPSYREIMAALHYKSVSTVAVHVEGLIKKGYLKKLEGSARALALADAEVATEEFKAHRDWLVDEVSSRRKLINERSSQKEVAESEILLEALRILGFESELKKLKSE